MLVMRAACPSERSSSDYNGAAWNVVDERSPNRPAVMASTASSSSSTSSTCKHE